ncbi:MAG: hypothetical protein AXW12_00615 [Thalassospira sp. Nap_22]|nr:MAG: hypothetical protein AXW12_00615 [Thalassospira sp. Nap_22]
MISLIRARELLDYNPDTGAFKWIVPRKGAKAGRVAGSSNNHGYIRICVDGEHYLAHRLAFIWMTGKCPEFVDHINGVRNDNRWGNIRAATASQNQMNKRSRKRSSSRFLGVRWQKRDRRWLAQIRVNRKAHHLGSFSTEIEAALAYNSAASEHFGVFANLNRVPVAVKVVKDASEAAE